ncbi:YwqJ-related putative deaminase [Streptomyces sp. RB6PN25]|uniref:YwqJ-related putative deaminase n=1 Tax=Streptomyces humicola TaxID=2953240 RepID=A0ABT1PS73_9ACTN|nr:YwqJ-related putative deaminase [Streptomyces humicola]MCQ4080526.1 YwqJ-related putative deaminase [Streptomyces humicola]
MTGAPVLRHRRDGILPAVAAALCVRGETLTCTGSKADAPPRLHPLVADFLGSLPVEQRERTTGRCPEAILLSRYLTAADAARKGRAARKPLSHGEAKRSLKHAKLTARRIREYGDPEHGAYAPPCRACTPLLAHFGVRAVDPSAEGE